MIPIDSALHGDVIIYQSGQENISTNVLFKDETFWMTQKDMATLFGVSLSSISRHLKNIFESNELDESVVIAEIAITTQHGALANKTQSSTVKLYNLNAIIAVGYCVNSKEATQFRIWATKVLHTKCSLTKGIFQNYKLIRKQLLSIKNLIVRRKYSLILTESYTSKTSNMMRGSKRLSNG